MNDVLNLLTEITFYLALFFGVGIICYILDKLFFPYSPRHTTDPDDD